MSISNYAELALLNTLRNTSFAVTAVYLKLHTGDPGEAGTQATSEAAYGSYARVSVARSGAGWTVTGNTVVNAALVQFPQCTSGSETITHVGVGLATSGSTTLLYKGALSSSLAVSSGIQPQFAASALSIAED